MQVEGRFQWRSYSISSEPPRKGRTISITVRAMPEGLLSSHLVKGLAPGTIVRLALPEGDFVLPDPPPAKVLFLVAGSGVTPVMSMLRTLDRRGTHARRRHALLLADAGADDLPRGARRSWPSKHDGLTLHQLHTDTDGMLDLKDLDELCPDWRSARPGPAAPARCSTPSRSTGTTPGSRTSCTSSGSRSSSAARAARAARSPSATPNKTVEADGATTVLEAGEKAGIGMPYGCRMGICHTCTLTLVYGGVKDLRNGEEFTQPNEQVQTCVTAALGDCTLDI